MRPLYDSIGTVYARYRQPDPRIAAQILAALGDASPVLNVGAGTGSYETSGACLAAEPSGVMIAQRRADAAPVTRAVAEALPFRDDAFGAATAILTVHHWTDIGAGLAEVRRVTRGPIVVLSWDEPLMRTLWLEEYLPSRRDEAGSLAQLRRFLPDADIEPVPVPHDCTDGFRPAYWRRPERYLDRGVQASISGMARMSDVERDWMERRLSRDLESGRWHEGHRALLAGESHDYGLRLLIDRGVIDR